MPRAPRPEHGLGLDHEHASARAHGNGAPYRPVRRLSKDQRRARRGDQRRYEGGDRCVRQGEVRAGDEEGIDCRRADRAAEAQRAAPLAQRVGYPAPVRVEPDADEDHPEQRAAEDDIVNGDAPVVQEPRAQGGERRCENSPGVHRDGRRGGGPRLVPLGFVGAPSSSRERLVRRSAVSSASSASSRPSSLVPSATVASSMCDSPSPTLRGSDMRSASTRATQPTNVARSGLESPRVIRVSDVFYPHMTVRRVKFTHDY